MTGSSSCSPAQPTTVHCGCSVQSNQRWGWGGRGYSQWERPSHSCYVKCSLAVIPLVTGLSSLESLLDRGKEGSPSSCHFITAKICSTLNKTGQCIKRHTWVKKFEATSELAVAHWANHQVATPTLYHCTVQTQSRDSVRVDENIPRKQTKNKPQTYKTSLYNKHFYNGMLSCWDKKTSVGKLLSGFQLIKFMNYHFFNVSKMHMH